MCSRPTKDDCRSRRSADAHVIHASLRRTSVPPGDRLDETEEFPSGKESLPWQMRDPKPLFSAPVVSRDLQNLEALAVYPLRVRRNRLFPSVPGESRPSPSQSPRIRAT